MLINDRRAIFQSSSFTGYRKVIIPIDSISSSYYGYHKPWVQAAILAVVLIAFGLGVGEITERPWLGSSLALLGLLVAAVYYFLNKELMIGIVDSVGATHEMVLQRSVIENKEINEQQMAHVTSILLAIIDRQKAQKLHRPPAAALAGG